MVAISVGNSRTRVGLFRGDQLEASAALENSDPQRVAAAVADLPVRAPGAPILLASVNRPFSDRLGMTLEPLLASLELELYRFGEDVEIPISVALEEGAAPGQDRLLNALGAYSRARQACIIVDAGTAVTVDFVDGEGVFQGGAIAPGLSLMLSALNQRTAALPEIGFEPVPESATFGKSTAQAMRLGVQSSVRGLVRVLAERYAEFYGAFPQIVATGGDARALFESDDLVEHIVPDLALLGIQAACRIVLAGDDEQDE
jgi:type III pantothenate kinase